MSRMDYFAFASENARREFGQQLKEDALARALNPRTIAGRANCGCVYHAEEGRPCPHDIALAAHESEPEAR